MAAGSTYFPIATTTVSGTGTSSVSFSSFSGYTDLILVINGSVGSNCGLQMRFNSDSGSNYSFTRIIGDGTSATSDRSSNATFLELGYYLSTARNMNVISIMNYANATTYKTLLNRASADTVNIGAQAYVEMWRSTSAITSLAVTASGNYSNGTTFTLYGIAAA